MAGFVEKKQLKLKKLYFRSVLFFNFSLPDIYKNVPYCDTLEKLNCVRKWRITYSKDSEANRCLDCELNLVFRF